MSSKLTEISTAESDQPEKNSVYDYLYYDARRIGSFLGQIDPHGHIQSLKHSSQTGKESSTKATLSGTAGFPGVANVGGGTEDNAGENYSRTLERTYDPYWGNARAFLDYLEQGDLLQKDLAHANIGQIVLAIGDISVFDLATVASLWAAPAIRHQIAPTQPPKSKGQSTPTTAELALDLISILPHGLQISMTSAGRKIWGSLQPESLVVSSSDLLLKHGAKIAGTWAMLAVLDAKPDNGASLVMGDMGNKILTEGFTSILEALGPIARLLLGRSGIAFGVTPLLIFREVGA